MSKTVVLGVYTGQGVSSKEYCYFAKQGELKVGDFCVVNTTTFNTPQIFKITQVQGLTKRQREMATRWIIQKVDFSKYEERMRRLQISTEIRSRLNERKEELSEMIIFQQLAKTDKKIAQLLKELDLVEQGENEGAIGLDTWEDGNIIEVKKEE